MAAPFVVSPWIRPLRVAGQLRNDNPVSGEVHAPAPLGARVVQALWEPAGAEERLEAIVEEQGLDTVGAAIARHLDGPDPETGAPSAHPVRMPCGYPWRSVVVLWDGRVVPCCRDDDARLVLGSLLSDTLEAIWQGPAARALRDAHACRSIPDGHLCHGCPWSIPAFAAAMGERHPDHAREEPLRW